MILTPHEIAWLTVNIGGWTGPDAETAIAIALAESAGNTEAIGRSNTGASIGNRDHGLWQISGRWHGAKLQALRWRDPYDNARLARQVFDEFTKQGRNGWEAWAVYNSGSYLTWVEDARIGLTAMFPPVNIHTTRWRT